MRDSNQPTEELLVQLYEAKASYRETPSAELAELVASLQMLLIDRGHCLR